MLKKGRRLTESVDDGRSEKRESVEPANIIMHDELISPHSQASANEIQPTVHRLPCT